MNSIHCNLPATTQQRLCSHRPQQLQRLLSSAVLGMITLVLPISGITSAEALPELWGDDETTILLAQAGSEQNLEQLFNEAFQLYQQGNLESLQQAIILSENIRQLAQETGEREREALALNFLGRISDDLGNHQQALGYYMEALSLWQELGDPQWQAATLNNIGAVYDALGDRQQASYFYNQALSIFREVGDSLGEATTLTNIGLVYDNLGERQQALRYYNQALPILLEVGDRTGEATTLNNIGFVYSALGDRQRALAYYNQALSIRREVGDRDGEANSLNNIGGIYNILGNRQQALDYYNQALSIRREVGDRDGEAATLNNIGAVYDDLGDQPRALEFYNQALPIFRQVGDRSGEVTTLNNIGLVYNALGDQPRALEFYNQALPIFRQVGDRAGEAATLNNIGGVYEALGNRQRALDYYTQALPIRREVGDRTGEAITLSNTAFVYRDQNEPNRAIELWEESLDITLELRGGLQQNFRDGFIRQEGQGRAVALVDLLIQQNQPDRAFEWLNRVSTYELADYTRLQGARVADPQTQAAIDAWNQDFQRLTALRQSLQNPELTETARDELAQQMRDLEAQVNQQGDSIAQTYPEAAELFETTPEDIATLQESIPAGTVVLQPVLLTDISNVEDSVALFLLSPDQPIRVTQVPIDGAEVRSLIEDFRASVQNRHSTTYFDLGADLYDILIRPIQADLDDLNPQQLAIIATDELRQIPFEALQDADTGMFLIQQYPVHYLTRLSNRSLLAQQQPWENFPIPLGGLAVVTGLVGIGLGRFTHWKIGGLVIVAALATGGYAALNPAPQQAVLAFGNPRPEDPFGLPGTETEVNAIPRYAPASQVYIRQAATLDQFQTQSPGYAYLHLATHGCFDLLGCDLSQDETPDMNANTLLFADQEYELKDAALLGLNDTQLVVLSACQTATATELENRAIAGLAYLFERAGAESVMANLWAVDDDATAQLSDRFYAGLLQADQSRVVALQQAKLELMQDYPHPFYWSPLVLIGDGR